MRQMRARARVALTFAAMMLVPAVAAADLTMSITPRFSADVLLKRLTPLRDLLSDVLGQPIEIVLPKDFADYEKQVNAGVIDIGFTNPTIYPLTSGVHEALAMLDQKKGGDRLRGLIVTRADSDIVSVEDLVGREVVIVGRRSTGGYLSQKVSLAQVGINTVKDMKLQEARDNKQENALLSVYYGDADAAFIREDALNIADAFIPPSQLRVIRRTAWMPNWAIAVKRSMPQEMKEKIKATVTGLKPGAPELEALKAKGLVDAGDADWDVVREALGLPIPSR